MKAPCEVLRAGQARGWRPGLAGGARPLQFEPHSAEERSEGKDLRHSAWANAMAGARSPRVLHAINEFTGNPRDEQRAGDTRYAPAALERNYIAYAIMQRLAGYPWLAGLCLSASQTGHRERPPNARSGDVRSLRGHQVPAETPPYS